MRPLIAVMTALTRGRGTTSGDAERGYLIRLDDATATARAGVLHPLNELYENQLMSLVPHWDRLRRPRDD